MWHGNEEATAGDEGKTFTPTTGLCAPSQKSGCDKRPNMRQEGKNNKARMPARQEARRSVFHVSFPWQDYSTRPLARCNHAIVRRSRCARRPHVRSLRSFQRAVIALPTTVTVGMFRGTAISSGFFGALESGNGSRLS
jgi:hypothetical protein